MAGTIETLWLTNVETSARADRGILNDLYTEGVKNLPAGQFKVIARAEGANMSVTVQVGTSGEAVAYVTGDDFTGQNLYRVAMTTDWTDLKIAAASGSNPRIDRVVLQTFDSQAIGGSVNLTRPVVIQGTPAASPVPPDLPKTAMDLALVAVAANAQSITAANITDTRVQAGSSGINFTTTFAPVTTAQRNALSPTNGQSVYNTTNKQNETYVNGLGWVVPSLDTVVYTTSGSGVVPPGVYAVLYEVIGGGGGGGYGVVYSAAQQTSDGLGGAGGSAGAFQAGILGVTPGQSLSWTIGAAGAAGETSDSSGGSGGQTSCTIGAVTLTSPGGVGGQAGGITSGSQPMSMYAGGRLSSPVTPTAGDGGASRIRNSYSGPPVGRVCGGAAGNWANGAATSSTITWGAAGSSGAPNGAPAANPGRFVQSTTPVTAAQMNAVDAAATSYGCGGGGGGSTNGVSSYTGTARGGKGGSGAVRLTYLSQKVAS